MDLESVDMKFRFVVVKEPFRTRTGKVSLKIPYDQVRRMLSLTEHHSAAN